MFRAIPVWVRWVVLVVAVAFAFLVFTGVFFGHGEGGFG